MTWHCNDRSVSKCLNSWHKETYSTPSSWRVKSSMSEISWLTQFGGSTDEGKYRKLHLTSRHRNISAFRKLNWTSFHTNLVTIGSAAWFGPHLPSVPLPARPVLPHGFLDTWQHIQWGDNYRCIIYTLMSQYLLRAGYHLTIHSVFGL